MDYKQIVSDAAKWLDQVEPGWWRRIDKQKLNLIDGCNCIMGQLCDGWTLAQTKYPELQGFRSDNSKAFNFSNAREKEGYWVLEIQSRLDADKQSSADKFIERTNELINTSIPAEV